MVPVKNWSSGIGEDHAMSSPLVDVVELRRLLGSAAVPTVLDVRYRMGGPSGVGEYARGHVPGASYVDLDTALAAPPGRRGRHPLPDPVDFVGAMQRAGVPASGPVVVYDDWAGRAAARCWWLLRHYGHRDVRVLDGGWSAWLAAGGEVETGLAPPAQGDFAGEPGALPVVAPGEVLELSGEGLLLDARDAERYRGEVEPVDPVAGHIPGAGNVPTGVNLRADGTFRSVGELREVYAEAVAAAERDAPVAAYCGSGVTACHDLLALATIGVEGALDPGSWSEWVTDPARPVASG
jgi:thiosulfate/3-mercaptopyruvate sulfurtransferase